MTCGVYQILNIVNGERYIGSSVNIERRWQGHLRMLRRGTHYNVHLRRAFAKYSEDAFAFEVMERTTEKECVPREQHFLDTLHPEYNIAPVAGSNRGARLGPRSEEHCRRISEAAMGRHPSEEARRKMSESARGRLVSVETRRKISEAKKGRKRKPFSAEWRRRLSDAKKGRPCSIETRYRISNAKKRGYAVRRAERNRRYGQMSFLESGKLS